MTAIIVVLSLVFGYLVIVALGSGSAFSDTI